MNNHPEIVKPISCVVLNYNDASTTKNLVLTIEKYSCFHCIVVVDNMSTDDSFERLSEIANERITVIRSDKNGGYGYGNNVGIRYIKQNFDDDCFVIANPDVIFSEETVVALVSFMRNNSDCGIVSAVQNNNPRTSVWRNVGLIKDQIFNSILLNSIFKPRYYPADYFKDDVCEVYAVSGCFFLAKMEAFCQIGLYDEDFFLFEEEKCIAKSLKECGWRSYLLTKYHFTHNHSVSIKKSLRKLGEGKSIVLKSNRLYLRKYLGVKSGKMAFIYIYHGLCCCEQIVWDFIKPASKRLFKYR